MKYSIEDLINWLHFKFNKYNPDFEKIMDHLIIQSGIVFTKVYNNHDQDFKNWINEISIILLDLSNNKYVQEIINTEPDKFKQIMKEKCNINNLEDEFKKEKLKIIPDKLNSFYDSFIEYCIQFIKDYIKFKLNIGNLAELTKLNIYRDTVLKVVSFYTEFMSTLT